MKKTKSENRFMTDTKLKRQKRIYSIKFPKYKNNDNNMTPSTPEKECSSINEIVRKSVEKINNLFQHQKFNETDTKRYNSNSFSLKNRYKQKENINFNSINTIEDMNKYNTINDKIKDEEDISENISHNMNSCSIVDASAIKRNVKQHSFDFKNLFKSRKESKNQIDYIQKSNQNEKKYIIQSFENYKTLFNPKSTIDSQESKINFTPLNTKKNYLFQSEIFKDMSDKKYSLNESFKTKENIKNKYLSFYRTNQSNEKNNTKNKNNFNIVNSMRKKDSKKYFDIDNKPFSNKKEIKNERYNSLRNNYTDNDSKNSIGFNFTKLRMQRMDQININSTSTSSHKKKRIEKGKTQNHFMNINNKQILKQLYSKEFPSKTKTNDILKLMLFLNEYIINNNLLDDYYIQENRKILDDYSKFLSERININYPTEPDIKCDDFVNKTKIIQRTWRKIKVMKYIETNKFEEKKEFKKMVLNNYIKGAGYKIKKLFGLFNNVIEQFNLLDNKEDFNVVENNINKCFYFMQKIIGNNLNNFEKNELYRDYINKIIYMN